MVTDAMQCIPLPEGVDFEHGAMHCVNPLTAICLVEIAKKQKAAAIVQSAACS